MTGLLPLCGQAASARRAWSGARGGDAFRRSVERGFVAIALLFALTACATAPQSPPPADTHAAWAQRQQALSQQRVWSMTGKLAVHTPQEGWFAGLSWQQQGERFQINLRDSFGRIVARIAGDDRRVKLTRHDGSTASAATPDKLTRQLFGWALPVSGLRYWVRGMPGPHIDAEAPGPRRKLDAQGRLAHLEQSGWSVDYQRYQHAEPVDLPAKIAVSGHDLRVKLVVQSWATPDVSARWR
ncbi:MAG: lipoprotein insertase outer membrane protein LolB [Gammaproteobacteria bacterium]